MVQHRNLSTLTTSHLICKTLHNIIATRVLVGLQDRDGVSLTRRPSPLPNAKPRQTIFLIPSFSSLHFTVHKFAFTRTSESEYIMSDSDEVKDQLFNNCQNLFILSNGEDDTDDDNLSEVGEDIDPLSLDHSIESMVELAKGLRMQIKEGKVRMKEIQHDYEQKMKETEAACNKKLQEMKKSYEQKLHEAFQCNICLAVPRDSIWQCQNGHLFCDSCMERTSDSCSACRTPLGRLEGDMRIRALGVEQVIDAVNFGFQCKYECDFSTMYSKSELPSHERKCIFRPVPCPHIPCAKEKVVFCDVMGHIREEHGAQMAGLHLDGTYNLTYIVQQNGNIDRIYELIFEAKQFVANVLKFKDTYYAFMHICGDSEEAKQFTVAITTGYGSQSAIFHQGQVFPIDRNAKDILKEKSGVVSFRPGGMYDCLFEDTQPFNTSNQKEITVQFKITKAASLNSQAPQLTGFNVSSLGTLTLESGHTG